MTEFDGFRRVVATCDGYLIEWLSFSRSEEADALQIGLRWGPDKPDVTLAFQNVHYFEIGRMPGPGAEPLDGLRTTVLDPGDESWPAGLDIDFARSADLPALVWLHAVGPVQLDVVAPIATAYVEVR